MKTGIWLNEEPAISAPPMLFFEDSVPDCIDAGISKNFIYINTCVESEGTFIHWDMENFSYCPCKGHRCPLSCQCQISRKPCLKEDNLKEMLRCAFGAAAEALETQEPSFHDVYTNILLRLGSDTVDKALKALILESDSNGNQSPIRRHAMRWLIQRLILYAEKTNVLQDNSLLHDHLDNYFIEFDEQRLATFLLQFHNDLENKIFALGWSWPKLQSEDFIVDKELNDNSRSSSRSFHWQRRLRNPNVSIKEIFDSLDVLSENVDLNKDDPSFLYNDAGQKASAHKVIKECNFHCTCAYYQGKCTNRRMQYGCIEGLEVFNTQSKSPHNKDDSKKYFLFEYAGEYVKEEELDRRRSQETVGAPFRMQFQFSVGKDKKDMYIDGTRFGNVSRFLNHSCDPNVKVHEILADHHDSTYPRVGFFAAREIEAGEELCWAYASTIGGAVLEKHDAVTVSVFVVRKNARVTFLPDHHNANIEYDYNNDDNVV
eukprot:CAMPEP_0117762942 /NCGR_PEP_ID=MMETSP0947-20121206/18297_1 /TAXON_ID=44440 /ORGANISM="Chattonella subsalsa, Strain CCMP2191" /LENGTH=485 /DNA_ID=CAMNT_0005584463 /DNA_START=164 /DNA_END=1623 /DNA_ORIENTATION=+